MATIKKHRFELSTCLRLMNCIIILLILSLFSCKKDKESEEIQKFTFSGKVIDYYSEQPVEKTNITVSGIYLVSSTWAGTIYEERLFTTITSDDDGSFFFEKEKGNSLHCLVFEVNNDKYYSNLWDLTGILVFPISRCANDSILKCIPKVALSVNSKVNDTLFENYGIEYKLSNNINHNLYIPGPKIEFSEDYALIYENIPNHKVLTSSHWYYLNASTIILDPNTNQPKQIVTIAEIKCPTYYDSLFYNIEFQDDSLKVYQLYSNQ